MSESIKLASGDRRALATALAALNEIEMRTGVRFSPNQRLEVEYGESYASGRHMLRPYVSVGRDGDDKYVLGDLIGD